MHHKAALPPARRSGALLLRWLEVRIRAGGVVCDVYDSRDLGNRLFDRHLDALAERHCRHAAALAAAGQAQIGDVLLHRDEFGPAAVGGNARVDVLVEHLHDPLWHWPAEIGRRAGGTDRWAGAIRVVDEDPAGLEISLAVKHGAA